MLIFIIIVLGTYYYLDYRTVQGDNKNNQQQEQTNHGLYEMPDVSQHENQPPNASEDDSAQTDSDSNTPGQANSSTDGLLDDSEQGSSPATEVNPTPEETASGDQVLIHFGGDTIFSGNVAKVLEKQGYDFPYQYVKELFQGDDLTVLNLETPVTYGGLRLKTRLSCSSHLQRRSASWPKPVLMRLI
ncbi:CapA family protein [Paenibacillus sp. D2_2]|nr:CapA family protein [Paenibacillus sp. D2_2]WMT39487.1 CapA family protein [Paenibacillus sp. D2_2]